MIDASRHSPSRRVGAMTLRYSYLLRSSYPRMLEMMYWPLVQMVTWGFLQTYLVGRPGGLAGADASTIAAGSLVGAVLLWDILLRGQQGFSFSFLEEMWSRNIANLFMSPLRPTEFVVSMMAMSLIRLFVGMVPVTFLAIWFFGFNLWALGLAFAAFFAILILFAWSVGLFVSGLLLRYGLGAEKSGLVADVRHSAARLRLLSGRRAARLAAADLLGAAADLCVRGTARRARRPCAAPRSDGGGIGAGRDFVRARVARVHAAAGARPRGGDAAANRRVSASS